MSEEDAQVVDKKVNDQARPGTQPWVRRGVMILVAIVVALILYQAAASHLPRWWAQRVANQVNGGSTAGTMWGLFYGFAFTLVPLLMLFQVRRRFLNWKAKIVIAVIALALAAPNWLTLSIVTVHSSATKAGGSILDSGAPGFRWGSLIGVVAGGVFAALLSSSTLLLARRRNQINELKDQIKQHKAARDNKVAEESEDS